MLPKSLLLILLPSWPINNWKHMSAYSVSTVAADALELKHQVISTHNVD